MFSHIICKIDISVKKNVNKLIFPMNYENLRLINLIFIEYLNNHFLIIKKISFIF